MVYVELEAISNFSFLRGASHPDELVSTAALYGSPAIGLADRNSVAGVVRAHAEAKKLGNIRALPAARLDFRDGTPSILCYPSNKMAWGRLCQLLSLGKLRAPKGACWLDLADLVAHAEDQVLILLPPLNRRPDQDFANAAQQIRRLIDGPLYMAARQMLTGLDREILTGLQDLSRLSHIPLVATNAVHYHLPARHSLQDVLVAIRQHCRVDNAGWHLFPNAEYYLKSPRQMLDLFTAAPDAIARTLEIADICQFSMDELRYDYPVERLTGGKDPQTYLEELTETGLQNRYPGGVNDKIKGLVRHELSLIRQLDYAPYFLTVENIVRFARDQGILCQGRGSAANSAVCYAIGITSVDPDRIDLLFERFISAERNEPPDIDVDFEHERREEVIQYIYDRFGRNKAGLTATVITYRSRSAIREVGKVMGLSEDVTGRLAKLVWGWSGKELQDEQIREAGFDPADPQLRASLTLAQRIHGFPRHLSQHVGGFVITRSPLDQLSPIANAAMQGRTTIEWDKDDIETLGMLKIDVLGLGMLTCLRKCFDLIDHHHDRPLTLATIPPEEPAVYDMLCDADTIGVFQVESRAQMQMLPRLKPREFYDIVIEVSIVRPGPIQGDMVHPYLRRRRGEEDVTYPSPELERVLGKTLGVPLFQEQAMQIAIVGAGFSPARADQLRRAMATFRKTGLVHSFCDEFIRGMVNNGYEQDFAERCFGQIEGFGEYGFPESHAASFSLLVYVSAWVKHHYPAAFACGLLNSQPMGFYAPAQLVGDAQKHGVHMRPVDVNHSFYDSTLETDRGSHNGMALRLGLRQVKGFGEADSLSLVASRDMNGRFIDIPELAERTSLSPSALEKLALADAFGSLGLTRRESLWHVRRLGHGMSSSRTRRKPLPTLPLFEAMSDHNNRALDFGPEPPVLLPETSLGEEVVGDYGALRLSLKAHPCSLLRGMLAGAGTKTTRDLDATPHDGRCTTAGLVLVRQKPGTASGTIFITLEDEYGVANLIVWPKVFEKFRATILTATLLGASGKVQRDGKVVHLIVDKLVNLSSHLQSLSPDTDIKARPHRPHPRMTGLQIDHSPADEVTHAPPIRQSSRDFR